jgi:GGDEF domain-containing protein
LRKVEGEKIADVLAELVSGIRKKIRKSDFVARYSRNIFVIQLTNTDSRKAKPAIERIESYLKGFSDTHNLKVDTAISDLEKDDTFDTLMEKLFNQLKEKEQ